MKGKRSLRPTARAISSFLLCVLVLSATFLTACESSPSRSLELPAPIELLAEGVIITLGERETLLADDALGFSFFPDEEVSVIQWEPTLKLILAATRVDINFGSWPLAEVVSGSWLVEGADMRSLDRATEVLVPGPAGSYDNGYAGFSGSYIDPNDANGRIYGFYHAEDQEDMPPLIGQAPRGFHATVALATSDDGGYTWEKHGPVLTSHKPKGWFSHRGQGATGVGVPGVLLDSTGEYLYLFYADFSTSRGDGVQTCIARARLSDGPPMPGTWQKYYEGSFSEPGIGGRESAIVSAYHLDEASASQAHVVYSETLGRYVMIVTFNFWKEWMRGRGDPRHLIHPSIPGFNSGIYVLYSKDLIHWSEPHRLIKSGVSPRTGKAISWEATVLWDPGRDDEGWLVYAHSPEFGHPMQGATPTHLVGRRIRFALEEPDSRDSAEEPAAN